MIYSNGEIQKKHIAGLDGLRGIATLAVVLYHMFPQQVKGGFLGVSLFFVLSGYLMAVTSNQMETNGGFHVLSFFRKRILKIYPALIIVVTLTVIFFGFIIKIPLNNIQGEILSIVGGYNNWWQISQNTSYFTKTNGASGLIHLWSVAVEMQFYLIWPVLFFIYKMIEKKAGRTISIPFFLILSFLSLACAVLGYKPNMDNTRIYYGTDSRLYALLFGSAIGFMPKSTSRKTRKKTEKPSSILFLVCMIAILFLFVFADGQSAFTYWFFLPISCFLFLIILLISINPRLPYGKLLDASPFSWLGKYSYEIYLCQYPITFAFKIANKGRYPFWQILLELLIVILTALILHNSFASLQRRTDQKRCLHIICVLAFLLIIISSALSSKKLEEHTEQTALSEELQANTDFLNTQKEDAAEINIKPKPVDTKTDEPLQESTGNILFIGDSVMLGAVPKIQALIPNCILDAAESRQLRDALEVLNEQKKEEPLGDCVVIGLGSNGPFNIQTGQDLIDAIGSDKKIYWISVYGKYMTWQEEVNALIFQLADANENVTVIDWASFAQEHSEWFYNDGLHLNSDGQAAYADFLNENISTLEIP